MKQTCHFERSREAHVINDKFKTLFFIILRIRFIFTDR
jgi:hypothetical protein